MAFPNEFILVMDLTEVEFYTSDVKQKLERLGLIDVSLITTDNRYYWVSGYEVMWFITNNPSLKDEDQRRLETLPRISLSSLVDASRKVVFDICKDKGVVCNVIEVATGESLVVSTLDFCIDKATFEGWVIENAQDVLTALHKGGTVFSL